MTINLGIDYTYSCKTMIKQFCEYDENYTASLLLIFGIY